MNPKIIQIAIENNLAEIANISEEIAAAFNNDRVNKLLDLRNSHATQIGLLLNQARLLGFIFEIRNK